MSSLISSQEATRTAELAAATALALLTNVNAAILSAALAGQFTLTYDITGQLSTDVTFVSNSFVVQGFTTIINPITLTLVINWPL